jgi:hypothetical protein
MDCAVEDCRKPAARGGLCWACVKAKQRTGTVSRRRHVRHATPREMVLEAARNLAEVDAMSERAWTNALSRFWMAVLRHRRRRNNVHKSPDTLNRG